MGLSIAYQISLPTQTPRTQVVERLEALRQCALRLPFGTVTELFECTEGDTLGHPDDGALTAEFWFRSWAALTLQTDDCDDADSGRLPDAVGFLACAGPECEPAAIGLAWASPRDDAWSPLPDLPRAWHWISACKTQYASIVSDEHFTRCHGAVVALLDEAVQLGFTVSVLDEGEYWESRDRDRLLAHVHGMNRLAAHLGGAIHDALGDDHKIEGAIFAHPDFERLETAPIHLPSTAGHHPPHGNGAPPEAPRHNTEAISRWPDQSPGTAMLSLDEIVDLLDHHGQRATYGAVARVLGHSPRSLLKGRERSRAFSWIVNRETGLPTGYADDQIDPRVRESGSVISQDQELRRWLEEHGKAPSTSGN